MAWTAPRTWVAAEVVTAALLNTHLKDNLSFLSTHTHSAAAGDGEDDLTGLNTLTFDDQAGSPATNGRVQRNGTGLEYYNGTKVVSLKDDEAAGTPSLRSLGTGATQAAAGNHTHTLERKASGLDIDDDFSVPNGTSTILTASVVGAGEVLTTARSEGTYVASDGSLSGNVKLYINGVEQASHTFVGAASEGPSLQGSVTGTLAQEDAQIKVTNSDNPGTIT